VPQFRGHSKTATDSGARGAVDAAEAAAGLGCSGGAAGPRHRGRGRRPRGCNRVAGEAIYRTVTARLEGRRPKSADVELLNEHGSHAQLTPRLDRTGAVRREGTPSQLLARLAADLLDLLAGPHIEKVKGCAHPGCSRLCVDSSRAQNRHWWGMGTCGNKAKVRAFRERQRTSESAVAGVGQSRTKGSRR
jgi:CGNR zinc finger/Putative stress-induced transcription regulator